jgi:hypothetical protein
MGYGILEIKESRQWNFENVDETTMTAVYLAWWEPTTVGEAYPGDGLVLTQTGMPMVQTRPAAAIHTYPPASINTFIASLVCRSVIAVPEPAVPYTWRVTAVYSTMLPVDPSKQGYGAKQTMAISGRQYAEYRRSTSAASLTLPTDGAAAWPPAADIGGTKIDLNGMPRAKELPQITRQLEYKWDRTPLISTTTPDDPDWQVFYDAINKRNSVTFMDASVGTMLYKGFSATLDREIWRIVHTWIFDSYYHVEQMPVPNPTGQPILLPGVTVAGLQINQCEKVGWYQPYPLTVDFMDDFLPATIEADLIKAYPPMLF